MNINKLILKLENEIQGLKEEAEDTYNKKYHEMEVCYLKNSSELGIEYHSLIAYTLGKQDTLKKIKAAK
jgi:hypothetical protein